MIPLVWHHASGKFSTGENIMYACLWHIDGYHRLIKWRIVIHGGIDGYSRLPIYMKASTNNRAETVLDSFLSAVHEYGLSSRFRSEKGGENVLVSQFMLDHPERGPGRKSFVQEGVSTISE